MSDQVSMQEFFNLIKTIVDNYMAARKPAAVLMGIYNGAAIMIGELPVPLGMITGNVKTKLVSGDKVRLLRNDRGREYYILEIISEPDETGG